MRNLILFDDETREALLPLTFTRPVCELRVGITTIREKWEAGLQGSASWITRAYLSSRYSITIAEDNLVINGSVLPSPQMFSLVEGLKKNEALVSDGELVAARIPGDEFDALIDGSFGDEISGYGLKQTSVNRIAHVWDIFSKCGDTFTEDFKQLTRGRTSAELSSTNSIVGSGSVFLEEGADVEHTIINTTAGPVYVGKNAQVMEGCLIRGPVALCEGAVLKMGAKIYGPTVIGPFSKVGGEVNNSVFHAYTNKGHEGFLGNSVIGGWCNLGADTNTSNLKNNYAPVRLYSYQTDKFEPTGLQFCGLIMGDHSKCGINTMFNTGTVVGVSANIFGAGYPRNFIPSFSWGGPKGLTTYRMEKAYETASTMMARKNVELQDDDREILAAIFDMTAKYRPWDTA
jgi:UDP-N-acetylglucosamine diphosphorylase/glucosamine-1-phosphate N-acetyltransferase